MMVVVRFLWYVVVVLYDGSFVIFVLCGGGVI